MQLSSLSNPYVPPTAKKKKKCKIIREQIEFRDRHESEISPCWKIITVSTYLVIVVGGIVTSISIGTLLAAFKDNCIFYARFTLRGLDEIVASGGELRLKEDNIVEEYYNPASVNDCSYCEYWSVTSTVFGGVLGVMFLQCGRGGITGRSQTASWVIVPPALIADLVFFIVSCIVFAKTSGGLSYFCNHLRAETRTGALGNITTCREIMSFNFPDDSFNTNLYLNFILAQIGAFITFFGWMVVLFILILRCFIPVDFVVYGRRLQEIHGRSKHGKDRRQGFVNARSYAVDGENSTSKTEDDEEQTLQISSSVATTSFISTGALRNKSKNMNKLE